MLGNGMAWGQLSHTLAWALRVSGLEPSTVYCEMNHSATTGADVYDAAIVRCTNGALLCVQGVGTVAGEELTSDADARPTGKQVENRVFGTEGAHAAPRRPCLPDTQGDFRTSPYHYPTPPTPMNPRLHNLLRRRLQIRLRRSQAAAPRRRRRGRRDLRVGGWGAGRLRAGVDARVH